MAKIFIDIPPGKYVVAVSGGVDSVVLLDLMTKLTGLDLIVAHFDHGIRTDSGADARLVKSLADKHKLPFELERGKLGSNTSEEVAREARYKFLRKVQHQHSADAIVMAHHQDDVIETVIINLLRGTYRKGLSSLKSTKNLMRPMLGITKQQIIEYAKAHNLNWHEDSTNLDIRYLRNYVRLQLIPAMAEVDDNWKSQILMHVDKAHLLNQNINDALSVLIADNVTKQPDGTLSLVRNWLIMLPNSIGREVVLHALLQLGSGQINSQQLERALIFCKTAKSGKRMEIGAGVVISVDKKTINITKQA